MLVLVLELAAAATAVVAAARSESLDLMVRRACASTAARHYGRWRQEAARVPVRRDGDHGGRRGGRGAPAAAAAATAPLLKSFDKASQPLRSLLCPTVMDIPV